MSGPPTSETAGPPSIDFGTTKLPTNPMAYRKVPRKIR